MQNKLLFLKLLALSLFAGCDSIQDTELEPTTYTYNLNHRRLVEYEVNRDSIWFAMDSTVYEDSSNTAFGSSSFNCSIDSVNVKGDTLFIKSSNHQYFPSVDFECIDSTYDLFRISTNSYIHSKSPSSTFYDSLVSQANVSQKGDTVSFSITVIHTSFLSSYEERVPEWFATYGNQIDKDSLKIAAKDLPTGTRIPWYSVIEHQFFYTKNK